MISVCDDILLEDMESQDFMDTFIDQSFHEAIDTLFGYDGENNYTYDSSHNILFPPPIKNIVVEETREDVMCWKILKNLITYLIHLLMRLY